MSSAPRSHRVRPRGPTSSPELFLNKASSLSVWRFSLLLRPQLEEAGVSVMLRPQTLGPPPFPMVSISLDSHPHSREEEAGLKK